MSLNNMNKSGQSLVEYILLLGMLLMIGVSIFKSDSFKDIFGKDSELFGKLRRQFEYEYRHGLSGLNDATDSSYGGEHESYYKQGATRFFSPDDAYP